ncbi:hypothetical protein IQ07DRAFT_510733 [Pyrenochaeta sp. DS3sAY3a]|nr:hypothetical protein IQ07DRAFT_510733 [Pyrenochaeta sp. DS3sAY3a]
MFGHPGISALEYAGSLEATRKNSTSATSDSLKRKSNVSTQDENTTRPTTAGTGTLTDLDLLPPVHFIDEFGCQQRRRGTFMNHTPREYEMRSSKLVEVYRPSTASNENYSRPRTAHRTSSMANSQTASQHGYSSSKDSSVVGKRLTINPGAPIELDATEISPRVSPDVYTPSNTSRPRSASVPTAVINAYHPRSSNNMGNGINEGSRSVTSPVPKPQEKKRQRRQTPFKIATPPLTNPGRHAPLEPLVAEHRRKASTDATNDFPPKVEIAQIEELGTFGVIQRYFESQAGGPVPPTKISCNPISQHPPNIPLPVSPEVQPNRALLDAIYPIDELDLPDVPPAVPDRSPKRLTNPSFPTHTKGTLSMDSEFAFAAQGEYCPYDKEEEEEDDGSYVPKKAGSANLGRMAPPILGHDALTASSHLGLNDLSYYLKHTGPPTDPQPITRPRGKSAPKIFRVKQKKSLAARVGSVEGSPQRARKHTPVPSCAREMTTSGGARHLKIIIPSEITSSSQQAVSVPMSYTGPRRRSRHVSITFTEEMMNPLGSLEVERMLSGCVTRVERSFSDPVPKPPRSPKRPPRSPKPVPVKDHPLASREEQARARKLRDLQRIKRKPLPTCIQVEQQNKTTIAALPTPAQTPEPGIDDEDDVEEDGLAKKMLKLQSRVVLLQRQNTELTEALAKTVGLELEDGDLDSEDVLKAFRQIRYSSTPSRI